MKVSQKISKLRRNEFYKRAWRRFQRKLHPLHAQPFLAKLDQRRVREIETRYADSPVQIAKYANVERWIKSNIERVQDLQLHRLPPQDILDLGCGGGFFLFICQQLGHRCMGLDLEWFPLFTELLDLFQIERKTFVFTLKENPRGRFLRITEDVGGRRDTIIIPAPGLEDFRKLLDDMVKASGETPPKT